MFSKFFNFLICDFVVWRCPHPNKSMTWSLRRTIWVLSKYTLITSHYLFISNRLILQLFFQNGCRDTFLYIQDREWERTLWGIHLSCKTSMHQHMNKFSKQLICVRTKEKWTFGGKKWGKPITINRSSWPRAITNCFEACLLFRKISPITPSI